MKNQNSLPDFDQNDEIDLFELFAAIWSRKAIILTIATLVIVIAALYLWFTPKVYQAKVYLSEVQPADIALLNIAEEQLGQYSQSLTAESVFALFQKNMSSRALALAYFKEHVEPVYRNVGMGASSDRLFENVFLASISVVKPGKNSDYFTVTHEYTDADLTAQWLNGYVQYVIANTKQELVDAALHNKTLAVDSYKKKMDSLRSVYQQNLQDQIVRLEEAFSIAKKLNLKKSTNSNLANKIPSRNLDESLLYMRGWDVLQAEIETLKKRTHTDPFISGIRPLQENINFLASVSYDDELIHIVTVDAWAEQPERAIKPKKALVLVLAGLLGGMLGVFIALIQWALANRKAVIG